MRAPHRMVDFRDSFPHARRTALRKRPDIFIFISGTSGFQLPLAAITSVTRNP
jgi:hypothetical protein